MTRYFRELLINFNNSPQLEASPYYQRWPYFVCLFKHAFEEGIVDRNDFLLDICEILNEHIDFPIEKSHVFRMCILFLSQFVDVITQNALLSRKIAYMIAYRFKFYKREQEKRRNSVVDSSEYFNDLIHCKNHRTAVLTMFGLLHAIIIDCPVALVWNSSTLPPQLSGSPLDLLPFPVEVFTQHLPKSTNTIEKIIRLRIKEIKKRSRDVEYRWALNPNSKSGFGKFF